MKHLIIAVVFSFAASMSFASPLTNLQDCQLDIDFNDIFDPLLTLTTVDGKHDQSMFEIKRTFTPVERHLMIQYVSRTRFCYLNLENEMIQNDEQEVKIRAIHRYQRSLLDTITRLKNRADSIAVVNYNLKREHDLMIQTINGVPTKPQMPTEEQLNAQTRAQELPSRQLIEEWINAQARARAESALPPPTIYVPSPAPQTYIPAPAPSAPQSYQVQPNGGWFDPNTGRTTGNGWIVTPR